MAKRRIPPGRYVIVADEAMARILRAYGTLVTPERGTRSAAALEEIARLENPTARQPGQALITDRSPRVFLSRSRTGFGPKTRTRHSTLSDFDPHASDIERFAKRLSRRLDTERRRQPVREFVLIAAPRFLGVLRPQLSAPTRELIRREIPRDLTQAADRPILRAAFPE